MEPCEHPGIDLIGLDLGPGDCPHQVGIGNHHACHEGRQQAHDGAGVAGCPQNDLIVRPQRLGEPPQAVAFEIDLASIPERPILHGRHLGKGPMNIESNDPHLRLLFGCTTSGAGGPHDTYGSAHAAHPGQSKGRPDNNASSQLRGTFGLPTLRAPDTPIPVC